MTQDALICIKETFEACTCQAERSQAVQEMCELYGVSRATLSRWAKKAGVVIRKERRDKGASSLSDAELKIVVSRLLVSKQVNGNFTNSVKNALEELEREGFTFPVGYERICTLLRERGYDKASIAKRDPHIRLKSLHPNHCWQFDVTNCLQWHLDNKTGLGERDLQLDFYPNKLVKNAKKIKRELLRFVIIDHCTGAVFFWYYYSPGERARDGADFFFKAFSDKRPLLQEYLGVDSTGWQMQGVPQILMSDKGSILRQKALRNLMGEEENGKIISGLGVKIILHAAGNPQAKGKVERAMRTIGTKFETILKIRRPKDLAELNEWALRWCIYYNENFVSHDKKLPAATYWAKITPEQLRLCPEESIYKQLIRRPSFQRTVDGSGHFPYENRQYYVPDSNACRQKVTVRVNAYEYPAVDVHYNGYVWLCQPNGYDAFDNMISPVDAVIGEEYRAQKYTANQYLKNELEEIASVTWGVNFKGNKQKRQSMAPDIGEEKVDPVPVVRADDKVIHIQRTGTAIDIQDLHAPETTAFVNPFTIVPDTPEERVISVHELIKRLKNELGSLTIEQNKAIKARYPNGITLTEAEWLLNNIQEVFMMEVRHA